MVFTLPPFCLGTLAAAAGLSTPACFHAPLNILTFKSTGERSRSAVHEGVAMTSISSAHMEKEVSATALLILLFSNFSDVTTVSIGTYAGETGGGSGGVGKSTRTITTTRAAKWVQEGKDSRDLSATDLQHCD
jgi:hypothetical protein